MTAVATIPALRSPWLRPPSSAASETASTLARLWAIAASHARDNATDWRPLTKALIEKVAVDHAQFGWDGYGAQPVAQEAKEYAQFLVDALPYRIPAPEPAPDPDGDVALCWDFGPGHMFTLSIGSTGILNYAGLLGEGVKRHGMEPFRGCIPRVVLESIEELCERAGA